MVINTIGNIGCIGNGNSGFRVKRPLITTNGFTSEVDETAKAHLDELNVLLGRRVFDPGMFPANSAPEDMAVVIAEGFDDVSKDIEALNETLNEAIDPPQTGRRGRQTASFAAQTGPSATPVAAGSGLPLVKLLALPLTPKQIPANVWANGSLLQTLQLYKEAPEKRTLSDYFEATPELFNLQCAFEGNLSQNWFNLDFNTKAVLDDYPAIPRLSGCVGISCHGGAGCQRRTGVPLQQQRRREKYRQLRPHQRGANAD